MAYTHRTDITVPIMTPTEASHPDLPSPHSPSHHPQTPPYDPPTENHATVSILSTPNNPSALADLAGSLQQRPTDPESLKQEAQSLIDTYKFTTKKAFKAYLDTEMDRLAREAEARARKRSGALRVNEGVEEEIRRLEARYETERRALGKRMRLDGLGQ